MAGIAGIAGLPPPSPAAPTPATEARGSGREAATKPVSVRTMSTIFVKEAVALSEARVTGCLERWREEEGVKTGWWGEKF